MKRDPFVKGAVAAVSVALLSIHTAKADLPLVAGNFEIAREFMHGDAHVVVIGDSEQNGLIGAYPSIWQVDHWSGIVAGSNLGSGSYGDTGAFQFGFTGPYIASYVDTELADTTDPAAAGAAPGNTIVVKFHNQAAPPSDNLLSNRVSAIVLRANQASIYHGGVWDSDPNGTMHADAILYSNPNGVSSGLEYDVLGSSSTTALASATVDTQSATSSLTEIPMSFSSQGLDSSGVSATFRMANGAAPAEGSNLVIAGVRFYNGQPGFQLANVAQGGEGIDYFINGADQNLGTFVQMTDTNLAYIWIGQNDTYTGPQFEDRMKLLLSKYKAARPDMKFVLVSTYDTNGPKFSQYAQALYDISQSDSSVLFLNLYQAAGSFSYLDENYLADHIHPNNAGIVYFANLTQSLLSMADSQAVVLPGDANLDGVVNSKDFDMVAAHFGQSGTYLAEGDFNGDGVTNALDFNALASNYGNTLSNVEAAAAVVPEPGVSMILLPILFAASMSRRVRSLSA